MIKYYCDYCKKETKSKDLFKLKIPDYDTIDIRGGFENKLLFQKNFLTIHDKEVCEKCCNKILNFLSELQEHNDDSRIESKIY